MRIAICFALLLLLLCATTASAQINETWSFSASMAAGEDAGTITVKQTGQTLEGTYSGILGQNIPIKGQLKGKTVTFILKAEWPEDGSPIEAKVTGELQEKTVSGTVSVANHGEGTWSASRTKAR